MLECKYVAGAQADTEFVFHVDNNRLNKGDILDYSWQYEEQFSKIKQFSKPLSTRTLPVVFFQRMSGNANELYDVPQSMYEIFDRDVRELKMGKLYIGDYFTDCYVVASSKKNYDNDTIISLELTVLSDFSWHKEEVVTFGLDTGGGGGGGDSDYLDFQYDFEYDYYGDGISGLSRIRSEAIAPFKFRLEFIGPVENPTFQIGNNIYRVFTAIHDGEKLLIDSREKFVYRILADGKTAISEFNNRDRDHYIFEPMPIDEGLTDVIYQDGCVTVLYAYVERSEPKWT